MSVSNDGQNSGKRSRRERSSNWSRAKAKNNSFFLHVCSNKQSHNQLRILLITYTSRFPLKRILLQAARNPSRSLVRLSLPHEGRFSIELRKGRKSWSDSGEAMEMIRERESMMIGSSHSSRTALLKKEKKRVEKSGSCCS